MGTTHCTESIDFFIMFVSARILMKKVDRRTARFLDIILQCNDNFCTTYN